MHWHFNPYVLPLVLSALVTAGLSLYLWTRLVDVWDALTSDRPYRKAWTEEKARASIQEQSGKHFDPKVVEAFFRDFD